MLYYFVMENLFGRLPTAFVDNLKSFLSEEEYQKYKTAINGEPIRGLRVNTNKIKVESFLKKHNLKLTPLNFCDDGFILNSNEKLGNSISHITGQFYLQEPSSMLAVCSSGIENENRPLKVLDLCASPGGKSGQIASRISNDSILFSNEIISSRAGVLYSNIERLGLTNVVVLNEKPENLLGFENYFDYVFVDAPCSGEGMFRKNPETIQEWSMDNVELCASRQKDILEVASKLVSAGGKLIYSTCTFSKEEDEEIVEWFLDNFNYQLQDVPKQIKNCTIASKVKIKDADFARKCFPFSGVGEGQFVAVFKNLDEECLETMHIKKHYRSLNEIGRSDRILVDEFFENNTDFKLSKRPLQVGDNIYLQPTAFDGKLQTIMDDLKFVTIGVKIGSVEKGRFEPNHNLFMAMPEIFKIKIELTDEDLKKYLHGEELCSNISKKGYAVVTKNGFAIGGVKIAGGKLKNLYPKGLRI